MAEAREAWNKSGTDMEKTETATVFSNVQPSVQNAPGFFERVARKLWNAFCLISISVFLITVGWTWHSLSAWHWAVWYVSPDSPKAAADYLQNGIADAKQGVHRE